MFNTRPQTNWNPYTIPATPTIPSGNSDVYSLSCEEGADGTKNPSQFLKWKKTNLPRGSSKGDLLYWDPEAGEEGAWVVLAAPSGSTLNVLTIQNGNLSWTATQDC